MFDCSTEILKFHDEKVTLSENEQTNMRGRRDANRERIKKRLQDIKPIGLYSQGSYAMHTMVQAPGHDYDIDDGIYFRAEDLGYDSPNEMSADFIKQKIRDAVSRGDLEVQIKRNCVRVLYGKGYHVDIPIYREITKNKLYELATSGEWKESSPRDVTEWFNDAVRKKSPDKENGRQMRRIVRFLKYFAKSKEAWKGQVPSGFVISVLVEECYKACAGRDDKAFYDTIKAIHERLKVNLIIKHPVIEGETLTEGASDNKVIFFREQLKEAIDCLSDLLDGKCEHKKALECWDKVFSVKFFIKIDGSHLKPAVVAPAVVTPSSGGATPDSKPRGFANDVVED